MLYIQKLSIYGYLEFVTNYAHKRRPNDEHAGLRIIVLNNAILMNNTNAYIVCITVEIIHENQPYPYHIIVYTALFDYNRPLRFQKK